MMIKKSLPWKHSIGHDLSDFELYPWPPFWSEEIHRFYQYANIFTCDPLSPLHVFPFGNLGEGVCRNILHQTLWPQSVQHSIIQVHKQNIIPVTNIILLHHNQPVWFDTTLCPREMPTKYWCGSWQLMINGRRAVLLWQPHSACPACSPQSSSPGASGSWHTSSQMVGNCQGIHWTRRIFSLWSEVGKDFGILQDNIWLNEQR